MKKQDQFYIPLIIVLSIVIPLAVAALMFLPDKWHIEFGGADLRSWFVSGFVVYRFCFD